MCAGILQRGTWAPAGPEAETGIPCRPNADVVVAPRLLEGARASFRCQSLAGFFSVLCDQQFSFAFKLAHASCVKCSLLFTKRTYDEKLLECL